MQTIHVYHLLQIVFVTVNLILVGFELSTSVWQSTHLILLNMFFKSTNLTLNHKSLSIYLCSTLKLYPRRRIKHNNDIYLPPTSGTMT